MKKKNKKKTKKVLKKIGAGYLALGRGLVGLGKKGIESYKYKQTPKYKKKLIKAMEEEIKFIKAKKKLENERKKLQPINDFWY